MQSTARPEALTGETHRPPSSREGDRRSGGRSKRIARPSTFRAISKILIQLRVQGRNPARFNGGYGVPRGFKGEKSKSPPNPLGLAERVPRPQAVEGVPSRHLHPPGSPAGQGLWPCRRLPIGALQSPLSPFARPPKETCPFSRPPVTPPKRPPSSREGDRPQAVEGVPSRNHRKTFPHSSNPFRGLGAIGLDIKKYRVSS